jgi:hypothetical protein
MQWPSAPHVPLPQLVAVHLGTQAASLVQTWFAPQSPSAPHAAAGMQAPAVLHFSPERHAPPLHGGAHWPMGRHICPSEQSDAFEHVVPTLLHVHVDSAKHSTGKSRRIGGILPTDQRQPHPRQLGGAWQ